MVYRAKITKIRLLIDELLNHYFYVVVKDSNDMYAEVKDEHLAELIEAVNSAYEDVYTAKSKLIDYVDSLLTPSN